MTLIKSISGIRGTIGGQVGENLTPLDTVLFASAYATLLKESNPSPKVVIGRDARISGSMIQELVMNTLIGMGIDVYDCDLSTTPTVEVMVPHLNADGGIILTASHNPKQWNALKLLNNHGEFIDAEKGKKLLDLVGKGQFDYAEVDQLGKIMLVEDAIDIHIQKILALDFIRVDEIKAANLKVVIDPVNSTGAISIPPLLEELGVDYSLINEEVNGQFAHNPEPLKENLKDLSEKVIFEKADFGIAVDPDVDRLALVCENGEMFGEEYTLVACTDYMFMNQTSATVSNLSSSRALSDMAATYDQAYYASAVGEVNVVAKMKEVGAVIGGEGNGGIILPELHYGRDALVGIAMFLNLLARTGKKASEIRAGYPDYYMSKNKIELTPDLEVDAILAQVANEYERFHPNTIDGVKIDFDEAWVHLRKSNTEPIIRIYTEATTPEEADELAKEWVEVLQKMASK